MFVIFVGIPIIGAGPLSTAESLSINVIIMLRLWVPTMQIPVMSCYRNHLNIPILAAIENKVITSDSRMCDDMLHVTCMPHNIPETPM